jgi:hypothetical protein
MDDVEKLIKQLEELDSMFGEDMDEMNYEEIIDKHGFDLFELEKFKKLKNVKETIQRQLCQKL